MSWPSSGVGATATTFLACRVTTSFSPGAATTPSTAAAATTAFLPMRAMTWSSAVRAMTACSARTATTPSMVVRATTAYPVGAVTIPASTALPTTRLTATITTVAKAVTRYALCSRSKKPIRRRFWPTSTPSGNSWRRITNRTWPAIPASSSPVSISRYATGNTWRSWSNRRLCSRSFPSVTPRRRKAALWHSSSRQVKPIPARQLRRPIQLALDHPPAATPIRATLVPGRNSPAR